MKRDRAAGKSRQKICIPINRVLNVADVMSLHFIHFVVCPCTKHQLLSVEGKGITMVSLGRFGTIASEIVRRSEDRPLVAPWKQSKPASQACASANLSSQCILPRSSTRCNLSRLPKIVTLVAPFRTKRRHARLSTSAPHDTPDTTFPRATNSSARLPTRLCILIIRQSCCCPWPRNYSVNYGSHGQFAEQVS